MYLPADVRPQDRLRKMTDKIIRYDRKDLLLHDHAVRHVNHRRSPARQDIISIAISMYVNVPIAQDAQLHPIDHQPIPAHSITLVICHLSIRCSRMYMQHDDICTPIMYSSKITDPTRSSKITTRCTKRSTRVPDLFRSTDWVNHAYTISSGLIPM